MPVTQYLHLLFGSALVQLMIVLGSAIGAVAMPNVALAAGGQCVWEGGPGVAGGHLYCKAEDCMGAGGLARCTKPQPAASTAVNEGQTGPGYWLYDSCDEQPPHMSFVARWCAAAGGDWVVTPGWNTSCENLPPDIVPGTLATTYTEDRAIEISDNFAQWGDCNTSHDDTGWGAAPPTFFCGGTGSTYNSGVLVGEMRQRTYHYSCRSDLSITLYRNRGIKCPTGYNQRQSGGQLQCYKPAELTCSPIGNPIAPFSGAKLQTEVDYRPAAPIGIELVRHYNSAGYYRPFGITAAGVPTDATPLSTDYWRHTYDRRLYLVTGNAQVLAIAARPDGSLRSFDTNGHEQANREGGGGDQLEAVAGSAWKLTLADRSTELYNAFGQLESISSPSGQVTSLTYGSNGLLSTVTGPFGHVLQFAYGGSGRLEVVTVPGNATIEYDYDAFGRPTAVTYPDGTTKHYHYEDARGAWWLTGVTDESAQRFATYAYDGSGRAISTEHAGGADRFELTYGTPNQTAIEDPSGALRVLTFTNAGGVYKGSSSNLPGAGCGIVKQSTFDASGSLATRVDFNNNQTHFAFDSGRNLETVRTEAFGTAQARTIETQWHPVFRVPTQVDEPGRTTTYTYDTGGNVLTTTVTDTTTSQDRTWTYTYNSHGQALTVDGPRTDVTDVTTFTYHECTYGAECGQLASVTDAVGNTTSFTSYNAHGQPLSITDPNNVAITLTYDSRQRLTSRDFGGEVTSFTYHPTGLLKRTTLPDGSYLENAYDAARRLIDIEDGEGNRIHYVVDAAGNRTVESVYDPSQTLVRTRGMVYDTLGRLLSELDAQNNTFAHTYDLNGNKDGTIDQESRSTVYGYDALNRRISTVDPMGGLIQYAYNARDEIDTVIDPRSLTTSYSYDGFGDLRQVTSPETGVSQYAYSSAGNISQTTDARGEAASFTYDAANRLKQAVYGDQTIAMAYDQGTNGRGRLTQMTDGSGSTHWTYTPQGRVASKEQVTGAATLTVEYDYNAAGQLSHTTTPSGQVIAYAYADGRLSAITVNGSPLLSNILYAPFGPTRGWSWSNGTLAVREYDLDGRIATIDSAGLSTYQFGPDGTLRSSTDDSGALATGPTGLTEITVDTDSNRFESSTGVDARTYSHDAAGNITGDGTHSFAYNDAGRMSSATTAGTTTVYSVNGLGQRVRKATGGSSRHFAYDEAGHLLGEYGNSGALIQETVWFGDIPVATLRPDGGGGVNVFFVHADHLNTPRRVSRPGDNAIVWRWDSDPFGSLTANEDADGDSHSFSYNLRFLGQYYDAETGAHYSHFRDYDPATGRYIESDPTGLSGGPNTYAYATNDPIGALDPDGLRARVCCRVIPALFFLGARHCYIERENTLVPPNFVEVRPPAYGVRQSFGLFGNTRGPGSTTGRVFIGDDFDVGGSCGKWTDDCGTDECVEREANAYGSPSYYSFAAGPNSNTFAGTVARKCNLQRSRAIGIAPGWGDNPAPQLPLRYLPPYRW